MTSRIKGWSNRQKDTGWGYALAHYIPGVAIYYSITRRTISNFTAVIGSSVLIEFFVVLIAINEFHFPSLFEEAPVDENTSLLIFFLKTLVQPFVLKLAISEARRDAKEKLKKIKDEIKEQEKDELKAIKEEREELKDEIKDEIKEQEKDELKAIKEEVEELKDEIKNLKKEK